MYKINKVDVQALTYKETNELYLFNKDIQKKYKFLDFFNDIDKYKRLFLSNFNNELYTLAYKDSLCGLVTFKKGMNWSGKEEYQLEIKVSNLNLDNDLFDLIDSFIKGKLNEHNQIVVTAYNDELKDLIKKYNNKVRGRSKIYTLKRDDIDIDELQKRIKELEAKNNDLKMVYTDTIPEEYIQEYCDLFNETMIDMTDEREEAFVRYVIKPEDQRKMNENNKKHNITHNCYMVFNSKNEMIAKTNVRVDNNAPRFPYQFMIGAKREYRGRGLGKWLYACMYKRLYENVKFQQAYVIHHYENFPAINVSESIGYKFNYLENMYVLCK